MKKMKRVVLIVLDGCGIGYQKDADKYGDVGANTLGHVIAKTHPDIPNLTEMGLLKTLGMHPANEDDPIGCYGEMCERAAGKDTTTGHWEIAGLTLSLIHIFRCSRDRRVRRASVRLDVRRNRDRQASRASVRLDVRHSRVRVQAVRVDSARAEAVRVDSDAARCPILRPRWRRSGSLTTIRTKSSTFVRTIPNAPLRATITAAAKPI